MQPPGTKKPTHRGGGPARPQPTPSVARAPPRPRNHHHRPATTNGRAVNRPAAAAARRELDSPPRGGRRLPGWPASPGRSASSTRARLPKPMATPAGTPTPRPVGRRVEIVASLVLPADRRTGRRCGWLPWVCLMTGTAASLTANVAAADPSRPAP